MQLWTPLRNSRYLNRLSWPICSASTVPKSHSSQPPRSVFHLWLVPERAAHFRLAALELTVQEAAIIVGRGFQRRFIAGAERKPANYLYIAARRAGREIGASPPRHFSLAYNRWPEWLGERAPVFVETPAQRDRRACRRAAKSYGAVRVAPRKEAEGLRSNRRDDTRRLSP